MILGALAFAWGMRYFNEYPAAVTRGADYLFKDKPLHGSDYNKAVVTQKIIQKLSEQPDGSFFKQCAQKDILFWDEERNKDDSSLCNDHLDKPTLLVVRLSTMIEFIRRAGKCWGRNQDGGLSYAAKEADSISFACGGDSDGQHPLLDHGALHLPLEENVACALTVRKLMLLLRDYPQPSKLALFLLDDLSEKSNGNRRVKKVSMRYWGQDATMLHVCTPLRLMLCMCNHKPRSVHDLRRCFINELFEGYNLIDVAGETITRNF